MQQLGSSCHPSPLPCRAARVPGRELCPRAERGPKESTRLSQVQPLWPPTGLCAGERAAQVAAGRSPSWADPWETQLLAAGASPRPPSSPDVRVSPGHGLVPGTQDSGHWKSDAPLRTWGGQSRAACSLATSNQPLPHSTATLPGSEALPSSSPAGLREGAPLPHFPRQVPFPWPGGSKRLGAATPTRSQARDAPTSAQGLTLRPGG